MLVKREEDMGSMLLVMWKNMEVRKLKQGGKICLKKKERKERVREARGISGILASKVRWYNRALTRSRRVEGPCTSAVSSLKRVLDRQGSKSKRREESREIIGYTHTLPQRVEAC